MPIDPGALEYALEQLASIESVVVKRMFGGAGLYARGYFFALFDNETLYFKTDDSNRSDYLAAGSPPFAPWGEGGLKMEYYEVPDLVLDSVGRLKIWMEKSIAVAISAKEKKQAGKHRGSSLPLAKTSRASRNANLGKIRKARKTAPITALDKKAVGNSPAHKKAKRKSS